MIHRKHIEEFNVYEDGTTNTNIEPNFKKTFGIW